MDQSLFRPSALDRAISHGSTDLCFWCWSHSRGLGLAWSDAFKKVLLGAYRVRIGHNLDSTGMGVNKFALRRISLVESCPSAIR